MSTKAKPQPALKSRDFFDFDVLRSVCEAHEDDFRFEYDMERVAVDQPHGADFYLFKDNGARVLAVAHLDTCVYPDERKTVLAQTAGGDVVYSGALDDRLGAYVIAELLPKMGITFDLLFTVGEESGMSTAAFFNPSEHHDRTYDWIIEFDRGGTDVVLYQYEDDEMIERVESSGARVAEGIFSDISYMEHLGTKAINWGVGYRDYHTTRGHVWLDDLFKMVDHFLRFYADFAGVRMEHTPKPEEFPWWRSGYRRGATGSTEVEALLEECAEYQMNDPEGCAGSMYETYYGLLCETHRSWYDD